MFLYYSKALIAWSMITLGASCSLYCMEREEKGKAPSKALQDQGPKNPKRFQLAFPYKKTGNVIAVAVDPTNNKPSILLVSKGNRWSAFSTNSPKPSSRDAAGALERGTNGGPNNQYGDLDFTKATREEVSEGPLKGVVMYIAPVNYAPAESLQEVGQKEFTWIPLDEFMTQTSLRAKPLFTEGITDKRAFVPLDVQLQKFITSKADTIKEIAAERPLPKERATLENKRGNKS